MTGPTRALLGSALLTISALALSGCSSSDQVAPPSPSASATATTGTSLPVDAAAFSVTGEDADPLSVVFTNGNKTVTFIPMTHIAKPEFYAGVTEKVRQAKEDGATLYYEFVDFDELSDADKRKARRMVGILPTPQQYAELAGSGYVGQSNDDYLGLVNDKDVDVDVTAKELVTAYEDEFGEIEVTGQDATSALSEPAASVLPPENVVKITLDARNQVVADAINDGPDDNIVLVFGAAHGPGIFADLKAADPNWTRTE